MALIGSTGGHTWPPVTTGQKGPAVKEYEVEINGVATTLQLSDEDAKARGLKPSDEVKSKEAKAPANKERTPAADKRAEAVSKAMNKPSKADG